MNIDDPFERRIQAQPFRPVPPGWRAEILGAAAGIASMRNSKSVSEGKEDVTVGQRNVWWVCVKERLAALFWPYGKAWASLAAVWLLILGLDMSVRDSAPPVAAHASAMRSPELRQMLQQQAKLMAELLGQTEDSASLPSHPPIRPRPRTEHQSPFIHV
ncbi:MAG TPA: hypothetical protein VG167_15625 [Verrucomicrobiae bacterium]|nr:hypothetical protein [Verrucomicrobiae bacterium]